MYRQGIDVCQYVGVKQIEVCCAPVSASPLSEDEAEDLAAAFKVLADPVRLRLFSLIAADDDGEVCACELVDVLGRAQPTISHHLKVLYEAGLLDREKRGTWVWYRAVPGRLRGLRDALAPRRARARA